jgi:hypothetical protein
VWPCESEYLSVPRKGLPLLSQRSRAKSHEPHFPGLTIRLSDPGVRIYTHTHTVYRPRDSVWVSPSQASSHDGNGDRRN